MTTAIAVADKAGVRTVERTLDALNFTAKLDKVYDGKGQELDGYRQILRTDTGACLSIVSDQYKLVEHREAMFPAVDALGRDGWKVKASRVERAGASAFVELERRDASIKVVGELVGQRVMLRNSYDKSSSLTLTFGALVLKCHNGAVVPGKGSFGFHSHHTGDVNDRLGQMLKSYKGIEAALGTRMLETYSQLDKLVPSSIGREIIKRSLGERQQDTVAKYWNTGIGRDGELSAWNLYQGITQFLTHDFNGSWDRRERLNGQALGMITEVVRNGTLPPLGDETGKFTNTGH